MTPSSASCVSSGAPQETIEMISGNDTRFIRVEFMFVAKYRYNVFRKQSTINACLSAFEQIEKYGYKFFKTGFGGTHTHFAVEIPKKYSIAQAEAFIKSFSSRIIFQLKPGFRKRYPRGSFWSGYEHHQTIGGNEEEVFAYIASQPEHHNVNVINDVQKKLTHFS